MKIKGIAEGTEMTHIKHCLNACIDDEGFINQNLLQNVFDYIKMNSDLDPAYEMAGKAIQKIIPFNKKSDGSERFFKAQKIEILLFDRTENKTYSVTALQFNTEKAVFYF